MSNLGLSICVSGYDTENIKQALSRSDKGKLDFWSLISGLFTVMPKGSFESILVYVSKTVWMKAIVLAHIQKQLTGAGFQLRLNNVIVDEVKNQLQIYCEFANVTFGDIYKIFLSYEGESEDPHFEAVIKPLLRTMDETVPNEFRVGLLVNVANSCRDGLCRLLEEIAKSEYGIDLSLDKLYVGTVNQWKGAIIL